ncbi:MAG: sce7726 family protein [Hyphomicrobium sp.]|uniref:sce7726 family protein n=1 Tax=Hyphomicrobium sp. TaxID=82 RepID=UPI003D1153AA
MLATTDIDIRTALHHKKLRSYREAPDTLVVDELGLSHAKVRIDIAVINGCVHGYEIKSSLDTLDRLPSQLALYRQCLGKLTLVCAPRHVDRVAKMAPAWAGIIEATKGQRGAISFATVRRGRSNPDIDPVQLAHLLWRAEAASLLSRFDASPRLLRQSRTQLYACLAQFMTIDQLTASIREFMRARPEWRDLSVHA